MKKFIFFVLFTILLLIFHYSVLSGQTNLSPRENEYLAFNSYTNQTELISANKPTRNELKTPDIGNTSEDFWNLPAMHINALEFLKNGTIRFTLFETSNREYRCTSGNGGQWFVISPCSTRTCEIAVNRMTDMLLSAKLQRKKVHLEANACNCSGVALKPM